jgi:tetratricopeptide (TPR) repeat protein
MNDGDTNSLFLLLYITLDFNKTFTNYEIQLTHTVEDIAVWIKNINEYKGYIAWAEIYFGRGDSEFTVQTLEELIQIYPENPEAYFKLWSLYENGSEESLEIAEKCFL